eukprot:CAMPEP_0168339316 /NCGR_PEP_ID=MMETSP0213-20121227/13384_1 /TAXON_ID=151035 /ORGANISM="Euplotes harpa, Strain FSP1.4" /LENGTH=58 /DNA_ID=CAMNT_0008345315 /DNA_START=198 /DNA_END=374 /DNA_ORIENTATION=-
MDVDLITDHNLLNKIGKMSLRPKFIVISEGEIKGVIEGADYAKLYDLVDKHIPTIEQE